MVKCTILLKTKVEEGKFPQIQEALEDYDDLRLLGEEKASSANEIARPLETILAELRQ